MPRKLKGYLMGPYTGADAMEMIRNIRHGLELSRCMRQMGFRTYCPWSDFLEALIATDRDVQDWKDDAIEELFDCDFAVLADMNPRWQGSPGTIDELATCAVHDIPVFVESQLWTLPCWANALLPYHPYDQEDDGDLHG